MDRSAFREALLVLMERKTHWAWPAFTQGRVAKQLLHVHLEQEYATYVRDFPVLVGRAYVKCPFPEARRELIENVYEEETGGLFAGRPHPELFLEYPLGLGMDLARFDSVQLLPAARAYREVLDAATERESWDVAAAVTTLFVEGTPAERAALEGRAGPPPPLEDHPLVRHYGLPIERLLLTKAHRAVEGDHRRSAWRVVLDFVSAERRPQVVRAIETALAAWGSYRDGVAEACGLDRNLESRATD